MTYAYSPLYVDRREDSSRVAHDKVPLIDHLLKLHLPAQSATLPFGDVSFLWRGKDDIPISVGLEIKKISDAVACMRDGRFAGHQLPGMYRMYQRRYLILVGEYSSDRHGNLVVPRGNQWVPYADIIHLRSELKYASFVEWLTSLVIQGGVIKEEVNSEASLVRKVAALYEWGQQPWASHRSLQTFDRSGETDGMLGEIGEEVDLAPMTLVRRWAACLPGIGFTKSVGALQEFGTPRELANADEKRWSKIAGIGKGLASKVVKAIRGVA